MDYYGNRTFSEMFFNFGKDNVDISEYLRILFLLLKRSEIVGDYCIRGTEFCKIDLKREIIYGNNCIRGD